MKSKLKYLTKVSLGRKVNTKWFKITNLIIAIVLIGIINIDSIITFFGGDFDSKLNVYVMDNANSFEIFKNQLLETNKSLYGEDDDSFEVISYGVNNQLNETSSSIEESNNKILEEDENNIIIEINEDIDNVISATIKSKEAIDSIDYQLIVTSLTNTKVSLAISKLNMTEEQINQLYSQPTIERVILDEGQDIGESQELIMTTVFPIVILPFFMLTIFLVQMIGAEVNDEKTTKGMEIIISNVSPKTHFFSKVIAGNLFVIIQGLLLVLYSAVGLYIRKMVGGDTIINGVSGEVGSMLESIKTALPDNLYVILGLTLLLMLITFIGYSLVAGILSSVTTNQEDFQQIQSPIVLTLLLGYYLAIMAGVFKGSIFIKIIALIPFISAILAPSLLVLGQFGILEFLLAIVLMGVTIFLLIKYGLRVYKVGILNYSSSNLWKKIFASLKQK